MKLYNLLNEKYIAAELSSENKIDVINEMVDLFRDDNRVTDLEKVRASVLEREKILSTGVGKNFAIPHGKTDAIDEILCAFGKSSKPIDFESLDHQPVYIVFLLVGKENLVSLHIKLLSRISRMMSKDDFRKKLMNAKTSKEIMEIFKNEEDAFFDEL
ncbi:MAG: PTS sugar transporter subunit IIA [Ignavibacteriaceae bacterium]|nr:PTS sugar transporter subunit IIA [Ignavibacteriaceae bacterium]NUM72005.1 PTS sugar transporter subunit IIA [Ignavibacteriaceae bacterium]